MPLELTPTEFDVLCKLEIDPDQPRMLKNVCGIGYKLDLA